MIRLTGRIDTTNAGEWEEKLISAADSELDAEELTYISSAGLRVLLKLKKQLGKVEIMNVSPEVFEILDVTGFTDLLDVKQK